MELVFKEAPPNFSVPFSGHPKTSAALSSYVCSWHWSHQYLRAFCSVAHLWTVCSLVLSHAKLSRAGWDNVWESFSWCLLWVQNSSLTMCTDCVLALCHCSLILTSEVCSCHRWVPRTPGPLCDLGFMPSQISKLQYSSMALRLLVEIITLFIIFTIWLQPSHG